MPVAIETPPTSSTNIIGSTKPIETSSSTTTTTTASTSTSTSRRPIVFEDAVHDDVPHCARIATEVFAEVTKNIFRAGPTEDQVAFRTTWFDKMYEGMLAYQQGLRTRPQRVVVARDAATRKVVAFIAWMRQGAEGSDVERHYAQTDEVPARRERRHPDAPPPQGFDPDVREDFVRKSTIVQANLMGQRTRCYIKYVAVDPNVQRTGAGRSLLHITRVENSELPIFLEAATTASAEQFYVKMNFKCLGHLDFEGAQKPLPCMVLEPNVSSLIDQDTASISAAS